MEAEEFGNALEVAMKALESQPTEDITWAIEAYLGLLEFAWQAEVESLVSDGYSSSAAESEVSKRRLERLKKRWAYVPRMRPPRGMDKL